VNTVYLANALCSLEQKEIDFEQFEPWILKDFGIADQEQLDHMRQTSTGRRDRTGYVGKLLHSPAAPRVGVKESLRRMT